VPPLSTGRLPHLSHPPALLALFLPAFSCSRSSLSRTPIVLARESSVPWSHHARAIVSTNFPALIIALQRPTFRAALQFWNSYSKIKSSFLGILVVFPQSAPAAYIQCQSDGLACSVTSAWTPPIESHPSLLAGMEAWVEVARHPERIMSKVRLYFPFHQLYRTLFYAHMLCMTHAHVSVHVLPSSVRGRHVYSIRTARYMCK
jgi:hypothetical protein